MQLFHHFFAIQATDVSLLICKVFNLRRSPIFSLLLNENFPAEFDPKLDLLWLLGCPRWCPLCTTAFQSGDPGPNSPSSDVDFSWSSALIILRTMDGRNFWHLTSSEFSSNTALSNQSAGCDQQRPHWNVWNFAKQQSLIERKTQNLLLAFSHRFKGSHGGNKPFGDDAGCRWDASSQIYLSSDPATGQLANACWKHLWQSCSKNVGCSPQLLNIHAASKRSRPTSRRSFLDVVDISAINLVGGGLDAKRWDPLERLESGVIKFTFSLGRPTKLTDIFQRVLRTRR